MNRTAGVLSLLLFLYGCGSGPAVDSTPTRTPETRPIVPTGPRTLIVGHSKETYPGISRAINAAKDGDIIKVLPGTYSNEYLAIEKPLTIIGDGKPGEIIVESNLSGAVGFKTTEGSISNITFHDANADKFAIWVIGGHLTLENCDINATGTCVGVFKPATLDIKKCKIHGGKTQGMFVNGATAVVEECDFYDVDADMIQVFNGAKATFRSNKIHGGKKTGAYFHSKAEIVFENNDVYNNGAQGVGVSSGAVVHLKKNHLHENGSSGLFLYEKGEATTDEDEYYKNNTNISVESGSKAKIHGCKLHDSEGNSIYVLDGSSATIEKNEISGAEYPGIAISNATAKIKENTIQECSSGILVKETGNAEIDENRIFNNTRIGLWLRDGSKVTARKNTIEKNGEPGIVLSGKSGGTFENNDLRGNKGGSWIMDKDSRDLAIRNSNKEDETILSKAKVGDWIDQKIVLVMGTQRKETNQRVVVAAKTSEDLTVEITMAENGQEKKSTQKVLFFDRCDFVSEMFSRADDVVEEPEHGREVINVGTRSLPTIWQRYTATFAKNAARYTSRYKVWRCAQVPLDNNVRVEGDLPNSTRLIVELTGFGDASNPPGNLAGGSKPVFQPKESTQADKKSTGSSTGIVVYVLKDGKTIRADKVVDGGDELSIKDQNGKFHMVKKSEIAETRNE